MRINYITKGSSGGATLSFALRSKGEGGQPRDLIIEEIASHFSTSTPPPPPRTLRQTQNIVIYSVFCAFGMEKVLLATCWKLGIVNTRVFARHWPKNTVNTVSFVTRGKKHRKYRGFGLRGATKHQYLRCFLLESFNKNVKTPNICRFSFLWILFFSV